MAHDTDPANKKDKPDDDDVFELPDFPDADPVPPELTDELDALPDFVPTAEAPSGELPLPEPQAAERFDPVAPASGWLEVPSAHGEEFAPPDHVVESSDIFSGGHVPRATAADHSDVLRATANSAKKTPTSIPPGDIDDLPLAEEVDEVVEESSLFPNATAPADRFRGDDSDAHDYGASPPASADASNILADLAQAHVSFEHDASGVRLDAPGMERTLTDEPVPDDRDSTAVQQVPRPLFPAADQPSSSTDWRQQSGSDLFADARTVSDDDDDQVNPFTNDMPDQPSLGSAQSSIFSGGRVPGATASGSDNLRKGAPSHPTDATPEGGDDDASILDAPALGDEDRTAVGDGGGIDFDLPKRRSRGEQTSGTIDSGSVHWTNDQDSPSMAGSAGPEDEWIVADGVTGTTPAPENKPPKGLKGKSKSTSASPPPKPAKARKTSDPSVVVDFVSESAEESAVTVGKTTTKKLAKAKSGKGGGGLVGGVVGLLAGVGACAGLYFGGVLDKPAATGTTPPPQVNSTNGVGARTGQQPAPASVPTVADAQKALAAGDPAEALKALEAAGADTTEAKATRGQARLLARLRDAAAIAPNDPELAKVRDDLQAVANDATAGSTGVKAAIHLGLTHELAGNRAEARKVYEAGQQKFPKSADVFQAALDRLSATDADAGKTSLLPRDAEQLALAASFLIAFTQDPPPPEEPAEAGGLFWKAANAAAAGKYADAADAITQAKAAHQKRAKFLAGRGLNPLSDPLEQIFPKCCDDLKAYWDLRAAVYGNKALAAAKTPADVSKTIDGFAAAVKTAETNAKETAADLVKAKDEIVKTERDLKLVQEKSALMAEEVKKLVADQKTTDAARAAAESTVAALVKELQGGKFLPEKFEPAAVLPAQKEAIARAGLTAADLVKLSERVKTSEAEAKAATEKLAADTKKMKDDYAADMKKLTDAHAVEIKKFTDNPIADKLKADHAAEVKKLTEGHLAAMKKAAQDTDEKVKKFEAMRNEDKNKLAAAADEYEKQYVALRKKFEADLGNAVSPTQTLDIWLPLLNTARRPADADPATVTAEKVLATAPKDSEDAAKALVVSGLATHIKGNVATAKGLFAAARSNPTYAPSKEWAKIADAALGRIEDPTGGSVAANPLKKNPAAAARALDAGITAYKAGRYADAVKALGESTTADASNPLSWYYLGAARWQTGGREQAAADFRVGAEREADRTMSAKSINDALAPIQGPARDALTNARP